MIFLSAKLVCWNFLMVKNIIDESVMLGMVLQNPNWEKTHVFWKAPHHFWPNGANSMKNKGFILHPPLTRLKEKINWQIWWMNVIMVNGKIRLILILLISHHMIHRWIDNFLMWYDIGPVCFGFFKNNFCSVLYFVEKKKN
jgi:hypothetical protein